MHGALKIFWTAMLILWVAAKLMDHEKFENSLFLSAVVLLSSFAGLVAILFWVWQ